MIVLYDLAHSYHHNILLSQAYDDLKKLYLIGSGVEWDHLGSYMLKINMMFKTNIYFSWF